MAATEKPKIKLSPMDNVYSYLMFTLPYEDQKARGRVTWNKVSACALVFGNFFFQGILLYSIFKAVVINDLEWREGIMGPMTPPEGCNPGGSLCTESNGTFSCAPPSVQLTGRWDELDTDGDGIWTHDEVVAARDELMCKYVVDPVEVFNVFKKFLLKRENLIWIHPDLRAGKKIHKAYFTYAAGDLIMCGYRDEKMCANLLERGVFDAPLEKGTAPRVGKTIDSALDYCFGLLESGGTCERTLPSTYSVWKKSSSDQCLGAEFEKYVYEHPTSGEIKSMLKVDYKARHDYKMAARNQLYVVFKSIIIGLFILSLWVEFKDIVNNLTWVLKYPTEFEEVTKKEDGGLKIQGTSPKHRLIAGAIVFVRFVLLLILGVVGVSFLQQDVSWVDLLLNGVALVFVLQIANQLWAQVIDPDLQEAYLAFEPMTVEMIGPRFLNERPALKDCLAFTSICVLVCVMMYVQFTVVSAPLADALECACLSDGEKCHEADKFSKSFWDKYWTEDVPAVFAEVDRLKAAMEGNDLVPDQAPAGTSTLTDATNRLAYASGSSGNVMSKHRHKHGHHHSQEPKRMLNVKRWNWAWGG